MATAPSTAIDHDDDDDNPTWTKEDFARSKGPESLSAAELANFPRTAAKLRGRPKSDATKVAVNIRLDPDVVAHFKAAGAGWQSRVNAFLRSALAAD